MARAPAVGLWVTGLELEREGRTLATVHTASMRPLFWPGARVWLRRATAAEIRPGDPVVFQRRTGPCLHRLIRREGQMLVTRGDASPREDPSVHPTEVIGAVEGVVVGVWQWRAAPRWLQRGCRRILLPVLPLFRIVLNGARLGRRTWRRVGA